MGLSLGVFCLLGLVAMCAVGSLGELTRLRNPGARFGLLIAAGGGGRCPSWHGNEQHPRCGQCALTRLAMVPATAGRPGVLGPAVLVMVVAVGPPSGGGAGRCPWVGGVSGMRRTVSLLGDAVDGGVRVCG